MLLMEFMALANHRKEIGEELAAYADQYRRIELTDLSRRLEEYGLDPDEVPAEAVLVAIAALSRTVVTEQALGMETGLPVTLALVEQFLDRFEGTAGRRQRRLVGAEGPGQHAERVFK